MALSFAKAGASRITLIGRTEATLAQTKSTINALFPCTHVLIAPGDLSSKDSITAAFELAHSTFGTIDIFVSNAGYLSSAAPVTDLDPEDWWTGMKTNALGSLYSIQAFASRAAKNAVVLNVSSAVAHCPPIPGFSGYGTSKLAGAKLFDYFQAENPGLRVVNLQPGVVVTMINQKSGMPGMDDGELSLILKLNKKEQ
jgi:NAD(P)-dependent dehydrogenase (short-subunit alcohol dehydrogenase family)